MLEAIGDIKKEDTWFPAKSFFGGEGLSLLGFEYVDFGRFLGFAVYVVWCW